MTMLIDRGTITQTLAHPAVLPLILVGGPSMRPAGLRNSHAKCRRFECQLELRLELSKRISNARLDFMDRAL